MNPTTMNFGQTAHGDGIDEVDDDFNGNLAIKGIKFNRSQTPFYLYFGLLAGKTALHKTVGKFFADKINAVTLQGMGDSKVEDTIHNQNNINNSVQSPYSIYRTCLGQTVLPSKTSSGFQPGQSTSTGTGSIGCNISLTISQTNETMMGANDGTATVNASNGLAPYTYLWSDGQTTQTASLLAPGVYTITVTDSNLCDFGESVNIQASTTTNTLTCYEFQLGPVTQGGNSFYNYTECDGTFHNNEVLAFQQQTTICTTDVNGIFNPDNIPITPLGTLCNQNPGPPSPSGQPNYTMQPLPYNISAAIFPRPIATNELIYMDGTNTDWYWGWISGGPPTNNTLTVDSGNPGRTGMGNIVVDFSQTNGPAVVPISAYAGTKLDINELIWNVIPYSQYNPFIWVTFGLRKVDSVGGGTVLSTYDTTPIVTHTNLGFCGTCEEEGNTNPQIGDKCIDIQTPGTGSRYNPFGPGYNWYLHGFGGSSKHRYWQVGHDWDTETTVTIWEEGRYEYFFQVHGWHPDLTEGDGYVVIGE